MKFNTRNTTKTTNLAGGDAYSESPKLELVSLLLTSFVKDQFYRSEKSALKQVGSLIDAIPDKKFSAKAAIYARKTFGMRSISHVVAGELLKRVSGEEWMKNFLNKVVNRPDDITEITAYYLKNSNPPHVVTNSMRKGFAKALEKLDEYQVAKYRGEKNDVSLVDVVNLFHPKSTPALKKLIKGTLKPADTWETKLSEAGKKAENEEEKSEFKKEVWIDLIAERRLGYFAVLRNLRNIIQQAPEILPGALAILTDKGLIKKSLVFPFNFVTAFKEIQALSGSINTQILKSVVIGLSEAIDLSLSNVPELPGETAVVLDISGSMQGKPIEIGSLFAAVLAKANNADVLTFASRTRNIPINPLDSTVTIAGQLLDIFTKHSGGTDFHVIFPALQKKYDRVIILSDMQGWMGYGSPTSEFYAYKTKYKADPFIYSFDLQGYGTLQFPESRVCALAGFSAKVFDLMKLVEKDRKALVHEIEKVEL